MTTNIVYKIIKIILVFAIVDTIFLKHIHNKYAQNVILHVKNALEEQPLIAVFVLIMLIILIAG